MNLDMCNVDSMYPHFISYRILKRVVNFMQLFSKNFCRPWEALEGVILLRRKGKLFLNGALRNWTDFRLVHKIRDPKIMGIYFWLRFVKLKLFCNASFFITSNFYADYRILGTSHFYEKCTLIMFGVLHKKLNSFLHLYEYMLKGILGSTHCIKRSFRRT